MYQPPGEPSGRPRRGARNGALDLLASATADESVSERPSRPAPELKRHRRGGSVGTASGLDQSAVYAVLDAALAAGDDNALYTGNPGAIIPGSDLTEEQFAALSTQEQKQQRRQIRNRLSAQLHRQRQRQHIDILEQQVGELQALALAMREVLSRVAAGCSCGAAANAVPHALLHVRPWLRGGGSGGGGGGGWPGLLGYTGDALAATTEARAAINEAFLPPRAAAAQSGSGGGGGRSSSAAAALSVDPHHLADGGARLLSIGVPGLAECPAATAQNAAEEGRGEGADGAGSSKRGGGGTAFCGCTALLPLLHGAGVGGDGDAGGGGGSWASSVGRGSGADLLVSAAVATAASSSTSATGRQSAGRAAVAAAGGAGSIRQPQQLLPLPRGPERNPGGGLRAAPHDEWAPGDGDRAAAATGGADDSEEGAETRSEPQLEDSGVAVDGSAPKQQQQQVAVPGLGKRRRVGGGSEGGGSPAAPLVGAGRRGRLQAPPVGAALAAAPWQSSTHSLARARVAAAALATADSDAFASPPPPPPPLPPRLIPDLVSFASGGGGGDGPAATASAAAFGPVARLHSFEAAAAGLSAAAPEPRLLPPPSRFDSLLSVSSLGPEHPLLGGAGGEESERAGVGGATAAPPPVGAAATAAALASHGLEPVASFAGGPHLLLLPRQQQAATASAGEPPQGAGSPPDTATACHHHRGASSGGGDVSGASGVVQLPRALLAPQSSMAEWIASEDDTASVPAPANPSVQRADGALLARSESLVVPSHPANDARAAGMGASGRDVGGPGAGATEAADGEASLPAASTAVAGMLLLRSNPSFEAPPGQGPGGVSSASAGAASAPAAAASLPASFAGAGGSRPLLSRVTSFASFGS